MRFLRLILLTLYADITRIRAMTKCFCSCNDCKYYIKGHGIHVGDCLQLIKLRKLSSKIKALKGANHDL